MGAEKTISVRKLLQALYYIQSHAPADNPCKTAIMYLLKILFFADRYHLRHFGFLAAEDTYFAMKNGPVASATLNILHGCLPNNASRLDACLLSEIDGIYEYNVCIKKQDDDELSESFKLAMDFAIKTYGKYTQFELSDISHDYPEWKKFECRLGVDANRFPMCVGDFFDNPDKMEKSSCLGIKVDPFADDDDFLKEMREEFYATAQ